MQVQFLGSGDAFGSGGRLQTCIYVRDEDFAFLMDCGTSSLIGMRQFGVDPKGIDAVLLTHLHGDHFGGIPFLLLEAQLVSKRRGLVRYFVLFVIDLKTRQIEIAGIVPSPDGAWMGQRMSVGCVGSRRAARTRNRITRSRIAKTQPSA